MSAEILKMIEENGVKFIDFRFTDTHGKEQHVSVPAHTMDESVFEEGKMFDGSSIAGWKGCKQHKSIQVRSLFSRNSELISAAGPCEKPDGD